MLNFFRNLFAQKALPPVSTSPLSNPDAFFDGIRKVTKTLTQPQVDIINDLVASAANDRWPISYLAYGLATAWHEARFIPQDEWGHGKGHPYAAPGKYKQPQYGRGLVQLTWDRNYEWADKVCTAAGLIKPGDILKNFDLVKRPDIAAFILVKGMETGAFTGKKLGDYLGPIGTMTAYTNARRIINGQDRAADIATYAMLFQNALTAGRYTGG